MTITLRSGTIERVSSTPTVGNLGAFQIDNLPTPRTYVLTFTRAGYAATTISLDLPAGQSSPPLQVVLVGGSGTVNGTVRDAAGNPLGGVGITVTRGAVKATTTSLTAGDGASGIGSYRISDLPAPGTYTVTFTLAGWSTQTTTVTFAAPGDQPTVDMTMSLSTGTVSGRVTVNGAGRAGLTLTLSDGITPRTSQSATSPSGGYEFAGVPPGTYMLQVTGAGVQETVVMVDVAAGATTRPRRGGGTGMSAATCRGDGMSRLYATVTPAHVAVRPGQRVVVELSLGNTSDLIDGFSVTVFGLDDGWRTVQPEQLSLFPGDTGIVAIEIHLPDGFPSGMRQLAVHVQSENDPTTFELVPVTLDVGAHPLLSLAVDPSQVTGGSTAQFGLVVTNHGNSIVDVIPDALDPEDLAEFEFAPVSAHLLPGEQAVFRAEVSARRPWVGQPAVRSLTFAACAPDKVESIATFVQRPRISRWLLSLLGLITAAAVFGAVLSHTLSGVVDEAKVSDALVNEALASGDSGGAQVSTSPATVNGTVVSASDAPIAGVQALLFESDNAEVPVASAATGADGKYAFTRLSGSTYRVKFTGAGFADQWYVDGRTFAEAKDVEVPAGGTAPLDPVTISGQPGGVSGRLIATDVTGATVRIVVPSQALDGRTRRRSPTSTSPPTVRSTCPTSRHRRRTRSSSNGRATRPQTRTVILAPGEVIDDLEIRLVEGNGVINGRVSAGGQPLGGVAISATDGTTTVETVSITTQGDVGAFVIRGLAVPGRYTVTFTREGYSTESRSVALESPDPFPLDVNLSSSVGSISGAVNAATGGPLGGVAVTVTGGDAPVVTSTISQGSAAGSWSVDGLAAPGSYTVTFSRMGYVSQTAPGHAVRRRCSHHRDRRCARAGHGDGDRTGGRRARASRCRSPASS